ncbi:hypothetical protein B0H13DRAFT_2517852 [Mycena leptocephala]|nr:hypothetical protein B0H13DRAFT_2517852 [Mycena leptocephala]
MIKIAGSSVQHLPKKFKPTFRDPSFEASDACETRYRRAIPHQNGRSDKIKRTERQSSDRFEPPTTPLGSAHITQSNEVERDKSQRDPGPVGGRGVEDDPRTLAQPPQQQTHRKLSAAEFGTKAPVGNEDMSQKEQQRRTEYGARNGRRDKMEVLVGHKEDAGKERDAGRRNRDGGLLGRTDRKGRIGVRRPRSEGTGLGTVLRTTAPPARLRYPAPSGLVDRTCGCQRVSAAILLAAEVEPDTGADADKGDTDDEGVKEVKGRLIIPIRRSVAHSSKGNTLHDDTCAAARSAGGDGGTRKLGAAVG